MEDDYVYKKEVDWSLLHDGLAIPNEQQQIFISMMGRFLNKGEKKPIRIYLNGKSYSAEIKNLNVADRFNRQAMYQIRYSRQSDLAIALRGQFQGSFRLLETMRLAREAGDRRRVRLPEADREYLAIYTTEDEDSLVFEPILKTDLAAARQLIPTKSERQYEIDFDFILTDPTATVIERQRLDKIRKLDRMIGKNLKRLYGYRCQICGQWIGEEEGTHVAEAHHIDYFTRSLNNDADNQMILCPNHHSIIHEANPVFDRKLRLYLYPNGYQQGLILNRHL